jgi:hypothetical protein
VSGFGAASRASGVGAAAGGGGAGGAGGGGARPWAIAAVLAGLTVLAVLAIGGGGNDTALDPRSDERLGTSAMVALAGELGADVAIDDRLPDLDGAGPDVIVLLVDLLSDEQRAVVDDWIDDGGRLIVTDPGSDYSPGTLAEFTSVDDLAPARTIAGRCEIDALDGIDVADIEPRNGGVLYEPGRSSQSCVDDGLGGAYIVATNRGQGTVVALGGSGLVVNAALARGENAPVVAALVAPQAGTDLLVLEPGTLAGGGGRRTLGDLIPGGVTRAIAQLAIAFVVYALWRSRRLGRPVAEPQPVAVAGSELVAAVGNLLDRTRSPGHAGDLLRADLRRFLADHLGVPGGSAPEVLATVVAQRTGVDEATLHWALGPEPVTDDAGLVALAHTIDRIRTEVLAHV